MLFLSLSNSSLCPDVLLCSWSMNTSPNFFFSFFSFSSPDPPLHLASIYRACRLYEPFCFAVCFVVSHSDFFFFHVARHLYCKRYGDSNSLVGRKTRMLVGRKTSTDHSWNTNWFQWKKITWDGWILDCGVMKERKKNILCNTRSSDPMLNKMVNKKNLA